MFVYRYKIKFDCAGYMGSIHKGEMFVDSTSEQKAIEKAKNIIELKNLIFCKKANFEIISREGIF